MAKKYVVWFFIYSFMGWAYETVYRSVSNQTYINVGFLYGPYCPIYGFVSLSCIILLYKKIRNIPTIFLAGMGIVTAFEYVTSFILELLFNRRWWNYDNMPFNIRGRVCLPAALLFGATAVLLLRILHPRVERFTKKLTDYQISTLCYSFLTVFIADIVITVITLL